MVTTVAMGCGTGDVNTNSCVPKATQVCSCPSGSQGVQICADQGSWSTCQCSPQPSQPNQPNQPSPPPTSPTTPDAGPSTPTTPQPQTGTQTCAQIDACMMSCSQGDTACYDSCFYQGTASAQAMMTALESCMDTASVGTCQSQCITDSQQCDDCLDQVCQAQLTACVGTGTGTGTGGQTGAQTCAQMDACMMSCSQSDTTCFDTCFYQGTANAQSLMTALEDCMDTASQGTCQSQCATDNQQCDDCLEQTCQAELTACLGN